jgi:hypothetical protein
LAVSTGHLQDSGFKPSLPPKVWHEKNKEDRPIVSMSGEEREEVWDDIYLKEEGIVLEFDPDSNTGKIKSQRWWHLRDRQPRINQNQNRIETR